MPTINWTVAGSPAGRAIAGPLPLAQTRPLGVVAEGSRATTTSFAGPSAVTLLTSELSWRMNESRSAVAANALTFSTCPYAKP